MKLLIKHFPQIPCKPFEVPVESVAEAVRIMDILANYDLFQLEHNIKPDYSNVSCLCMWDEEEQEWCDWWDEETGTEDPWEYVELMKGKEVAG